MEGKVSVSEKVSYAVANLGNIPIQTLISSYLLIFYTNVVGLNPAACATLFLIARVLDGINDPFIGYCIDHLPTGKMGHFRPALIAGTILCSLNFLLLWFGPLMAPAGKLAVAYVSYILIGVLFPIMDISLNSLLPVMTDDMEERNNLSTIKGIAYMGGMVLVNIAAPIILGDTSNQAGYVYLILIATAMIFVCSIVGALGVRERIKFKPGASKYGVKEFIKILSQRPVWTTFLCTLMFTVGMYMVNTANTYFYTYVIGNLTLLSVATLVQFAAMLIAMLLGGKLIGRYGKKNLYAIGLLMFGVLPVIRLLNVTNIPLLMAATFLCGLGAGLCTPLSYGIQADNTDYVEIRLGYRAEAAVASLSSFVTKCAMGVGGAVPGYLFAATGFDSDLAVQPDSALTAINLCVIVLPAVLCLIGGLVFGFCYPLTKEKLIEQSARINELRAAENVQ